MPRIRASDLGLVPHWKARIGLPGGMVHVASSTEPEWDGRRLHWTPIEDHDYGDTVGFVDWSSVIAVTWRFSP